MTAVIIVAVITCLAMLVCIAFYQHWEIKAYKKLYSQRGKQLKKIIKQIEDYEDIKKMLSVERARLVMIINKHPEAQKEYLKKVS